MTISRAERRDREEGADRCGWCARLLPARAPGPGRPRRWCRAACRQRAYEARVHERADGDVVAARRQLEATQDHLWALARALDDVERDLAAPQTKASLSESLDWLREAARAAVGDPA